MHEKVIILDFGGQYAHLIASRIRRQQVLAEIYQPDEVCLDLLKQDAVKGIILSGGPQSVYDQGSAACDPQIYELGKPVLGICYGHQYMNQVLGGKFVPGHEKGKEFGRAELTHNGECPLFKDIPETSTFWMSHGDQVATMGDGFVGCADTALCHNAAAWNAEKNLFGIQFHPEVTHSEYGIQLLINFLEICGTRGDWTIEKFYEAHQAKLKAEVGDRNIVLFVSGGVDSTVAFALLSNVIGADRVQGLFVDNGLLRQGERAYVENAIKAIGAKLTVMDEADRFLDNLAGVYDPEEKRKIIGNTFIDVQKDFFAEQDLDNDTPKPVDFEKVQGSSEERTESYSQIGRGSTTSTNAEISKTQWVLAQGTIYPDTIETGGTKNADTIKTHHNRVPEIQKMIDAGLVIEPLADLYKDEVRALGELMGLPQELVWRHPFPGPGLGVRILCAGKAITQQVLKTENQLGTDYITLPIKSVGVQGDFRTYRHPAILQTDTLDLAALENTATQLINLNDQVNRCLVPIGNTQPLQTISVVGSVEFT